MPAMNAAARPFALPEPDDVRDALCLRHFRRPVARSVVDDEDLDDVDAGHGPRQVRQRRRQRLRFVQAGDLDDQLRHVTLRWRLS